MHFRASIDLHGKTATGIEVPPEIVTELGAGRKPPVRVAFNGHAYRTTIASRGDRFLLPVSAEHRAEAGVEAGDQVDVKIELDTEPREVALPDDFAAALDAHPDARAFFDGLTDSQRKGFVVPIEEAKTEATRTKRVEKAVLALGEGRKRA